MSREAKSSTAEVDFIIEKRGSVSPLEIKSGKSGSLKSLHLMLSQYPDIESWTVLYDNIKKQLPEQKLNFFPLYYISSLMK